MFKVFNKIRKKLIDQNKTGRYLKYAFGEIVLVMIGILLALQVNTWNTNRELKKEELKVLKSLKQEFSENLKIFDVAFNFHLNRKNAIETMASANLKKLPLERLRILTRDVNNNYTFDPFQGIYNSVINSGKIELISNDSLKLKIARLQDLINDYKEEEINTMEFTQQNLYPFQLDNYKLDFNVFYEVKKSSIDQQMGYRKTLIQLSESDKYENLLIYIYSYMSSIFEEGPMLRAEMASIINILNSEIKKHEN